MEFPRRVINRCRNVKWLFFSHTNYQKRGKSGQNEEILKSFSPRQAALSFILLKFQ